MQCLSPTGYNTVRTLSAFRPTLSLYALMVLMMLPLAGSANAQYIDAVFAQQSSGTLFNINTTTGVSTTIATDANHYWNGAAFDPVTGYLYLDDLGTNGYTPGVNITNTIYSFNPGTHVFQEVGTVPNTPAFTGAGFYNGYYYTIPTGSNQLQSYKLPTTAGTGAIAIHSTQTLGGLPTGVTGLSLGDLDFKGSTLYISAGTVSGGTTVSSAYTLFAYTNVSNTTTPSLSVTESLVGVGVGWDPSTSLLDQFNSNNTLQTLNPTTGLPYGSTITITGTDTTGGAGDYAIIGPVPEPGSYAAISIGLMAALAGTHRLIRRKIHPSDSR